MSVSIHGWIRGGSALRRVPCIAVISMPCYTLARPTALCPHASPTRAYVRRASIDDGARSMNVSAYRRSGIEAFLMVCIRQHPMPCGAVVQGAMVVDYTCGDGSLYALQTTQRKLHALSP